MTVIETAPVNALRPYVKGKGVQFFGTLPCPFPEVPQQTGTRLEGVGDGELDFIVAGCEWLAGEETLALLSEWRRCLKEGGRLAVLADPVRASIQLVERTLALEVGLDADSTRSLDGGVWLITGTRSFAATLRAQVSSLGHEIGRTTKPLGWKPETYYGLGNLFLHAWDGANAAACFQTVVHEDPASLDARVGLALSLAIQSGYEDAEALLSEVLHTDPDHGIAREWLDRCRAAIAAAEPTVPGTEKASAGPTKVSV